MMCTIYVTPCLNIVCTVLTGASSRSPTLKLVLALISDIQVRLDLPRLIAYQLSLRTPPLSLSPSSVATMATHVFELDELATHIATHLLAVSPKTTVAFALTCKALEVPAFRAL